MGKMSNKRRGTLQFKYFDGRFNWLLPQYSLNIISWGWARTSPEVHSSTCPLWSLCLLCTSPCEWSTATPYCLIRPTSTSPSNPLNLWRMLILWSRGCRSPQHLEVVPKRGGTAAPVKKRCASRCTASVFRWGVPAGRSVAARTATTSQNTRRKSRQPEEK